MRGLFLSLRSKELMQRHVTWDAVLLP